MLEKYKVVECCIPTKKLNCEKLVQYALYTQEGGEDGKLKILVLCEFTGDGKLRADFQFADSVQTKVSIIGLPVNSVAENYKVVQYTLTQDVYLQGSDGTWLWVINRKNSHKYFTGKAVAVSSSACEKFGEFFLEENPSLSENGKQITEELLAGMGLLKELLVQDKRYCAR
jgi:hypothetical protein